MITPVRTLKVGVLCERKDDLLVSVDDIKMVANDARTKAIEEFAERIALEISESIIWGILVDSDKDNSFSDTSDKIVDYVVDTSKKIAEQMKGGAIDG